MTITSDPPPPSPTPPSRGRRALTLPVVLASTVLALTVAVLVYVALGGADDAAVESDAGPGGTTLELTPTDEAAADRDEALDLTFTAPDGTEATLRSRLDGRPMVVNFFASWCPPCIREMPDFQTVAGQTAGRVDIVGLAVQDRPEDAIEIVEETGIEYFWARDARGDIAGAIGVVQMPSTFFVDADGEIVEVHSGTLDADELRALIERHLGVES